MIIVDGEPISTGEDGRNEEEGLRLARLDLKLCKALATLNPPHELSILLHARITEQLRSLHRHNATDQDTRQAADLDDDELRQAADIIRAIRALPFWTERAFMGGPGFRSVLSGYALDIASELDKRTGRNPESQPSTPSL